MTNNRLVVLCQVVKQQVTSLIVVVVVVVVVNLKASQQSKKTCLSYVFDAAKMLWQQVLSHKQGRPQAWARGGICLPVENVQARVVSITTFWVRTKRTKIVAPNTCHRLKIYLGCDCGRDSAPDRRCESLQRSPDTLAGLKDGGFKGGLAEKEWQNRDGRREGREETGRKKVERNGRDG